MIRTVLPRGLVCAIAAAVIVIACATGARAQNAPVQPRGDVSLGAAFWNEDDRSFQGFHLTGAWRPAPHFGVVGDFVSYGDQRNTLMGGVRVQTTGPLSVFGQVLLGSAPLDDIAIQPGAGVDVLLTSRMAVRTGVDFKISGDDGSTFYGTRVYVAVAFLFGSR